MLWARPPSSLAAPGGVGGQWQTKLIYVGCGLAIFVISGTYRKLIAALGVIAFFGLILLCACNYGVKSNIRTRSDR
jgi:hypothetical protein